MIQKQFLGRNGLVLLVLAIGFPGAGWSQQRLNVPIEIPAYPNIIVYNGKVVTMDDSSRSLSVGTIAEAMAVRDGKIIALGQTDELLRYAGPRTQRIDLKGRTVLPGFINTHVHIHIGATSSWIRDHPRELEEFARHFSVDGKTAAELRHAIDVVLKEKVAPSSRPGQWAMIELPRGGSSGTGIGVKFLQERGITGQEVDRMTPDTPVQIAAHPAYIINTAARKAMEKLKGIPPVEVGPDGFHSSTEYRRIVEVESYFHDKVDLLAEVLRDALAKNAAIGVTTWASNLEGARFWDAFRKLAVEGQMPNRLAYTPRAYLRENPEPIKFLRRLGDMQGLGHDYFWQQAITGGAGGDNGPPMICSTMEAPPSVKSREWCVGGPGTVNAEGIYQSILMRHRYALGHAYADKGVDYFMDEIERAIRDDPAITLDYIRSRQFTMDHCGFWPRPDQIARIAKLGLIVSCAPRYMDRSAPWLEVYGKQYGSWIVPVKSLLAGGVITTYEDESLSVERGTGLTYFHHVPYLLTRRNGAGELIAPEEAVDRVTVMKMMTSWASVHVGRPDVLGTLELGKWADFVILNKDYFSEPVEEIKKIYPLLTVVGGKMVVLRAELAQELGVQPVGPQINFTSALLPERQ